jgi:hypothetical protein
MSNAADLQNLSGCKRTRAAHIPRRTSPAHFSLFPIEILISMWWNWTSDAGARDVAVLAPFWSQVAPRKICELLRATLTFWLDIAS